MREKYAEFGEICAKICGIYAAYMRHYGNMWRKWCVRVCLRWTKCAEMLKNAIAYAEICDYMRIFANLCINIYSKCIIKYSKFWKCHYMRENMPYAHFCKICEICCDRMIAINRYPYLASLIYLQCSSSLIWHDGMVQCFTCCVWSRHGRGSSFRNPNQPNPSFLQPNPTHRQPNIPDPTQPRQRIYIM